MEGKSSGEHRITKSKKGVPASPVSTSTRSAVPTKFVLKMEKQLEQTTQPRGRKMSRSSAADEQTDNIQTTPTASTMSESSFGVQSLAETIGSTYSSAENTLARTISNSSERSLISEDRASIANDDGGVNIGRKRKAGNRVHPTILATGKRIISSDHLSQASMSPVLTSQSPFRHSTLRRGSNTSSLYMEGQPLTPLRLSPHPESATPSTPRSGSPKSFRLSDEDSVDETSSQAIQSSSGDDEPPRLDFPPQLVMPSLSVPLRRPYTEQGRSMGRTKIMVFGRGGAGKTSFINSLYRSEHIVHMEGLSNSLPHSLVHTTSYEDTSTIGFQEIQASTRPYPSWWTDLESQRMLLRRSSVGEGVLERNLTFVDTPGVDSDERVQEAMNYLKMTLRRATSLDSMSDSEVVDLLSGSGGAQIDAAIYLFDPVLAESSNPIHFGLSSAHQELLQCLSKWTNLIPVISRSDTVTPEDLESRKDQISYMLDMIKVVPYRLLGPSAATKRPLAVSLAQAEDAEIDASVLMSSQYLPPLVSSELNTLIQHLLEPENLARMRHLSATKVLRWRHDDPANHFRIANQVHTESPYLRSQSPGVTSSGSILEEPSKVLVPHSSSSYYRSASPATSDISGVHALAHLTEQAHPSEPFRQVRLAKWAQDLQRSLANERRKYTEMYNNSRPLDWDRESDEKAMALTRPGRGRLGGDLGIIDPRDPLGVLALGRRSFLVMQIIGGCGLIGAAVYWIVRNWTDVQDYLGWHSSAATLPMMSAAAIPPPQSGSRIPVLGWIDEQYLRGFFGWR